MSTPVRYTVQDGEGRVVLDHGPLNLMNTAVWKQVNQCVATAGEDEKVRVLSITGKPGVFVAGADLKEIGRLPPLAFREFGHLTLDTIRRIRNLPKPVIIAVDGLALGAGCGLVFAADLAVATERSLFGLPEIHLGIFGGMGLAPWVLGKMRAAELMLLGERITAAQALSMGMINRVVPVDQLDAAMSELVAKLKAKSPLGLRLAKESLRLSLEVGPLHAGSYHFDLCALMMSSEDWSEGVNAFFEKRQPRFQGR